MRIRTIVILAASAPILCGCGSAGSIAASRPAPPGPVVLSVYIGTSRVRLSPARLGAAPMLLTVTNQSRRSASLLVSRPGHGRPIARTTPINSGGVTQLKLRLGRGTFAVNATPSGRRTDAQRSRPPTVAPATLRVGGERASGGGQTLQP
jgi:hypothetical protein